MLWFQEQLPKSYSIDQHQINKRSVWFENYRKSEIWSLSRGCVILTIWISKVLIHYTNIVHSFCTPLLDYLSVESDLPNHQQLFKALKNIEVRYYFSQMIKLGLQSLNTATWSCHMIYKYNMNFNWFMSLRKIIVSNHRLTTNVLYS